MRYGLAGAALLASAAMSFAGSTFVQQFEVGDPLNNGAGPATAAAGNPNQLIGPPNGPGGQVVAGGQFGNALNRGIGGRVQYEIANNWNINKGTIEMYVKGPGVVGSGFRGLMGTDTGSGAGDVRMYIYDTGAGRTLGAYMAGGGGAFWEIEQVIPAALLDDTNWHHVAWAFDMTGATPAARVTATWWDGQLLRNTPDAGTLEPRTALTATGFHIGENQAGSAIWPGFLDEFRISDDIIYPTTGNFTPPAAVPEPASLGLLCIGLAGLVRRRRA